MTDISVNLFIGDETTLEAIVLDSGTNYVHVKDENGRNVLTAFVDTSHQAITVVSAFLELYTKLREREVAADVANEQPGMVEHRYHKDHGHYPRTCVECATIPSQRVGQ